VENAWSSTSSEGCAVAPGIKALTSSLNPNQFNSLIVEKRRESANCVAATANTGDHTLWQGSSSLNHLGSGLIRDNSVEVPDDRWKRGWTHS
jgi:hypothetical protein